MVAQWYVMKAAAEAGMKVMLDGQGGDEIFAGYLTSYGPYLAELLFQGRVRRFASEGRALQRLQGLSRGAVLRSTLRSVVAETFVHRVQARESGGTDLIGTRLEGQPEVPTVRASRGSPLRRQLTDLVTRTQLPELLRYEDRNSMTHSIEARVPMLDHRLVELAFSLRGDDLIDHGVTKAVLRHALGDLLPETVAARTDKLGFVTPLAHWWAGGLREFARDVFSSQASRERGLVDTAACLRRLDGSEPTKAEGFALWRALNVELWADAFLTPARSTVSAAA
jgi:asparagine synthase (glutamine-hydrolysing)